MHKHKPKTCVKCPKIKIFLLATSLGVTIDFKNGGSQSKNVGHYSTKVIE